MAYIISQGSPSYTIPTEDIDLDYFFKNIHLPKNGLIKPLWTYTGNKRNDYYEFEIITKEKNNEYSEIYYDHNLICESYTCHICNINVPKIYRKEHNQTTKHKVCLEIADKSLERSRMHINEEYDHQKSIIKYDCYFCPSCCAAVATELKGQHEKTPGHLISVKHDDLLKEFLKYYIDRDNVTIDFELDKIKVYEDSTKINNTDANDNTKEDATLDEKVVLTPNVVPNLSTAVVEVEGNTVKNCIDYVANEDSNCNIPQCKAKESITPSKDIIETKQHVNTNLNSDEAQTGTRNNTVNTEVNGEVANNKTNEASREQSSDRKIDKDQTELTVTKKKRKRKVKDDNAEAKRKYYDGISLGHKVKPTNDDLLEIETINGDIVRVAASDFHSYRRVDGNLRCELCNLVIDDIFESHIFSDNHMIFAMAPIADRNCIRKCNLYYSHCILCNEVVKDAKSHIINNKTHDSNVIKALVASETSTGSEIVTVVCQNMFNKTYCEICEVDIDSNDMESHAKSKKHRSNYDKQYPSLDKSYTVKVVENKQNNSDLSSQTNSPSEDFCKICKVRVPSKNMSQHLSGNIHVLKCNTLLYDNKLKTCANGYYCNLCKNNIPLDNLVDHIDDGEHISNLNKLIAWELHDHFKPLGLDKCSIYCRVCEMTLANELLVLDEHVESEKHENNYVTLIEENQLVALENKEFYCFACNKLFQDKDITHINSYEHINAMVKSEKTESSPVNESKIHAHMQKTANPKELQCKVCLIAVPFLPKNIDEHVIGRNHIKNYNKIFDKYKRIDDKYFCETCKVFLNDPGLLDHDCEENRKEKLEITEVKIIKDKPLPDGHIPCRICKVSFPNQPDIVEKHNNSEGHLENCSKIMEYNRFVDNQDNYFFELTTVSESMCSNLSPNTTTKGSKKKKPSIIEVTKSVETQNALEIQVPETSTSSGLHDHMEYTEKPGSLYCKVCNVAVPNNSNCVDLHINGIKHENNYNVLLRDNKLQDRVDRFYCEFCETLLPKSFGIKHVFTLEHKINMEATASASVQATSVPEAHYLIERLEQTGQLHCKLCKLEFKKPSTVRSHLGSPNHTAIYKNFVEKNHLILKGDTYFCNLCNELLAKNAEYTHVDSKKHKHNMSPNKYVCKLCNVAIPNNLKNINEHFQGMLHQSKLTLTSD